MISGNYNTYNPQSAVSYGAVRDIVPNDMTDKIPENLQHIDAKSVANNNGALSTAQNANGKTFLLTLPIYSAFVGLRTINDKIGSPFTFAGEYDKTILGKLAKLGDKITGVIDKIVPDSVQKAIPKAADKTSEFLQKHFSLARSFQTPFKLENSLALQEANGLFGRVMFDDTTLFQEGFKGSAKKFAGLFNPNGTGSSFWKLLESKGIAAASDTEATKIVTDAFREIANQPVKSPQVQQYAKDIVDALSQSKETFRIGNWGRLPVEKIPFLGKYLTLEVPASEVANKIRVAAELSGSELASATSAGAGAAAIGTTYLGKALPNSFAKFYEGLTSDFVGGKLAPVIQAYFLASAAMRAKEAPDGQKLATFMDEETAGIATLFTLPIATSALTKIGGMMKYVGMGKTTQEQIQNVQKYRDMVQALNARVDAGTISRGEYLKEVKNIKDVLKGSTNFLLKPIKFLGSILGTSYKGETIKPLLEETIPENAGTIRRFATQLSNKVQNVMYNLKTGGYGGSLGGALRFALVMFVISPIVTKPLKWVVNKIFGKPYDPVKEKEEAQKKEYEEAIKNNPFAKMSDDEMINLLQKNRSTLEKIQNNPQLMQEIQTNPNKLYEILKDGADKYDEAAKNAPMSPILRQQLQRKGINPNGNNAPVQQNQTAQNPILQNSNQNRFHNVNSNPASISQTYGLNMNTNAIMPKPSVQKTSETTTSSNKIQEPKRTYIPSSKPSAAALNGQSAENDKFNAIMADIDRTTQEYSQYLNM